MSRWRISRRTSRIKGRVGGAGDGDADAGVGLAGEEEGVEEVMAVGVVEEEEEAEEETEVVAEASEASLRTMYADMKGQKGITSLDA